MIYSILMYVVGFLILLILSIYGIGSTLPIEHSASLEKVFSTSPQTIYSVIRDFKQYPSWRPNLKNIEEISSTSWKETDSYNEILTYSFVQDQKNEKIESKIMDENKPFSGSWAFEIIPFYSGTELKITETAKSILRYFASFLNSFLVIRLRYKNIWTLWIKNLKRTIFLDLRNSKRIGRTIGS